MEPGKRWIAGVTAAIAANSSGSAAAIAAGSKVPNRSTTFAGTRNACSIGYCWSSIIAASNAKGVTRSRIWSAAGSPVMWSPMGTRVPHPLRGCEHPASWAPAQPRSWGANWLSVSSAPCGSRTRAERVQASSAVETHRAPERLDGRHGTRRGRPR